jgi:hypothetical protein
MLKAILMNHIANSKRQQKKKLTQKCIGQKCGRWSSSRLNCNYCSVPLPHIRPLHNYKKLYNISTSLSCFNW